MMQVIKRGWKLKSRMLSLMLVISMVVSLLPMISLPLQQAAAAEPNGYQDTSFTEGFLDVSPTDWFYDAVVYVYQNGIFNGTDDDTFSPQGTMTRGMYVTALGRMAGVDISEYPISTFDDVQTGAWYASYVEWAAEKGITNGTSDRYFSPDATVSREQMVTMTLRFFESYQIPYQTSDLIATEMPADLAKVSSWAADAVVKLWQAGLFVGDANGNFNPHTQATRAEAAVAFMRSFAVVKAWENQNQATVTPTPQPSSDNGDNSGGTSGGNSGGTSGGNSNTEYVLTFDSNGGTAVAGQTVKYGSKAAAPSAPTKNGYVFSGWYSDSDLTIPYDFTTAVVKGNITLYAKWTIDKATSYTVSFISNGGTEVADQTVEEGAVASAPEAPTREGYTFSGWYSDSSLISYYGFTAAVSGDITLYAKWTITSYTVSFDSNGGSAMNSQSVKHGDMARSPEAPTREGYTFSGWYIDSDLMISYSFLTAVKADITLYARWTIDKKNSYTVSFISNGGTEVTDQTVEEGAVASAPDVPTREGYTFSGWYIDSSLTSVYSFTTLVTDNITLYAKWTASYTVSFDSSGGSEVADQTVSEDAKAAAPSAPTKNGYVFGGWYSDSDLTIPYDFTTAVVKGNITLYAKWTIDKATSYTVSFISNGGTEVADQTVEEGAVASAPEAPTREGYTFSGWYSDSSLISYYGFTAAVSGDITLYAKWTITSYTVSFDSNGGSAMNSQSVKHGDMARSPEAPTREGYTFSGWYSDSNLISYYGFTAAVSGDITLYAKWTITSYTVSFDSNGGSAMNSQSVKHGDMARSPEAPTREGYTFSGWYIESDLMISYSFLTAVKADITLYAKWTIDKKNSYTVSFISNGGTEVTDQTVEEGAVASAPDVPTREGYTFSGWYIDSSLTSVYSFTTLVTDNITLYAKWTASYTVSFDSSGGSEVADQTVSEDAKAAAPSAPTKNGYVFGGWYSDSDLTIPYDFTTAVVKGNITLYAKWTIDKATSYTVSFISNGGTEVADQTVEEGAVASTPDAPTREGYTFSGWYSDSSLISYYGFTAAVSGDITLYAKWTITSYTVSFDSNGGSAMNSQSVKHGDMARSPEAPTREGYTFSGWYIDSNLMISYSFLTAVKADITLYARWTITSYTVSFDSNGGSAVNSQSVNYGELAGTPEAPTQEDYTFDGWYIDSSLTIAYDFTTAVTGSITLYAKWTANIKNSYTVSFDSNGGSTVADQTVEEGEVLSKLPAPAKEGYIFQGWFRDETFALIFAEGSTIHADTTLYAKYIDNVSNAVESIPSYSVLDVEPSFTIAINAVSSSMTAAEVKAGMIFIDTTNPDPTEPAITGANGRFTVASAAEDGKFVEGNTYQLTLTDDRLTFQGQDATTRVYMFSVAKQEVMNIPLNPSMIYLPFADVTNMMLEGAEVGSPAIPVVSMEMGDSESGLASANAGSGTFQYTGDTSIQVGDTVAIYEGVRPDLRTVDTTGAADGDIAYIQITAISGTTYTYDPADIMQVLFMPDVLPVSVDADTDGDPDNHSITVEQVAMNYSDELYAPFGLSELTTVDVGDFIAFYTGEITEAEEVSEVIGYGRITSIVPAAEMMVIAYSTVTLEDITHVFDIYQQQEINGDMLLSEEEITQLEDQIEQQAIDSGFVDQAANYLSALAMETDVFKTQVKGLSASKLASKVSVENLTVVASLGTNVENIAGRTSGVSATLQIGADIVISIHEESDLVIHMTGTFVEEISLSLGVNGNAEWEEVCIKYIGCATLPIPKDYRVTANLDAYSYTGLNITAEIATVEHDKLAEALGNWDAAKNGGKLGKVMDIATEIQALLDGVQDSGVDAESLKEQYKEMMQNETEWVPLVKIKLFKQSMRVALNIIEIQFSAEFVVSANVNLTIGADFNYTTAKRISATLRVKEFSGTIHTVGMPGDGDYQFTFYVMGTLGLRAGIQLELKAGIGSVDWNSIGISVEPGAYVKLWGYFYYQLKDVSGERHTQSSGALYVEMGIYLESGVGAQLGDGLLSASVPIYEDEWPLYSVGEQHHVINFAYPQDDALVVNLAGTATSIPVPEKWLTMSTFDLMSGESSTKAYDFAKFDIVVDNPNFKYNPSNQMIEVVDKRLPVDTGNLVITWKNAPLTFNAEPLKRTISLIWLAREGDYTLQLDPQNGELTQVFSHAYNAAVSVTDPTYQGYTFDGWYTAASGGTKMMIPSQMPAEDIHLYAHWIANTDTPYTVEHYLIDPNTRTATSPVLTEHLTGTTGTEIRISSDRFKDQGYATGVASGVSIKGDGSTVVRVDYYPVNRTMTFDLAYQGAPKRVVTEAFGKNITARIPIPTRPGYAFAGWTSEVPSMMPNSDTTYTAQWTAKEDTPYQVVYLLENIEGNNTYTVANTETHRGTTDTVASLTNPSKSYEGFTFNDSISGTVLTAPIAGKGTTVLKLYYERNSYPLTLNYNSSSDETKVVNVPLGATTRLYLGTPTWQGHTFTGWSPAPPTTMPANEVELTAQWTLNNYRVSFNSNGGSEVSTQTVEFGSQASKPNEPTKQDWVFGGWYSDSGLTNVYDFATQVTQDFILYAKWVHSYTVTFDSDGGSLVADQTINEGEKAIAPAAPTKEGFVFSGWYSDSDLENAYDFDIEIITDSIILYAKWIEAPKSSYTVSFNSNGGTEVGDLTVEEGAVAIAPAVPTRSGYTFEGWYSDSELMNRFSFTTAITTNLTLYAKWTQNSYTVSFNSDGGTYVDSQTVEEGDVATMPAAPTKAGYKFKGWYSDVNGQTAYDFATPVMSSFTVYAKWTAVYTVSFNTNYGTPAVDDQIVEHNGYAVEPPAPTRGQLKFTGWYMDEGWTQPYNFTGTPVTGNLRLHAGWGNYTYMVNFESNGGSDIDSQEVIRDGRAQKPSEPKWGGYRFEGWYSDPDLEHVYDFMAGVTSDITLYAKWTMTSWLQLGDELGADQQSKTVFDSQGTPYIAYVNRNREVAVMKYEGDEWQRVGEPSELENAGTYGTNFIELAIDSQGTPYIAYHTDSPTFIVKKYNGDAWELVDSREEILKLPSIAFDKDDTLYLATTDKVRKYVDGYWEDVYVAVEIVSELTIAFDQSDTLYVFQTYIAGNVYRTKLEKTTDGGQTWSEVGNSAFTISSWRDAAFALDPAGIPYIAYTNASSTVVVSKYEDSAWRPVGTSGFLAVWSDYEGSIDIDIDSQGIPYIAYRDAAGDNRATVMKYENMAWSPVGYAGFSTNNIRRVQLAIDSSDNIYAGYIRKNDVGYEGTTNVMRYEPNLDQP